MQKVVLGPQPPEVQALIAQRRALGIDRFDEVWEGSYHVAPAPSGGHAYVAAALAAALHPYAQAAGLIATQAFNLGDKDDFRVPDGGYHRAVPAGIWVPAAAIVVEVLSPDDETYAKFGFYARHGVEEIVIADLSRRVIEVWIRSEDGFGLAPGSALLDADAADVAAAISWPAIES